MNSEGYGNVAEWFVAFWPEPGRWKPFGPFSHVTALGFSRPTETWIIYDVQNIGTHFRVAYALDDVEEMLNHFWCQAIVLKAPAVRPRARSTARFLGLGPFSCVTATKHLLGLQTTAQTPIGLYRHMTRIGCPIVSDGAQTQDIPNDHPARRALHRLRSLLHRRLPVEGGGDRALRQNAVFQTLSAEYGERHDPQAEDLSRAEGR